MREGGMREGGRCNHVSCHAEFQGLTLSDSGDADTIGPLPPGGIWSSDGEYSAPPYDYFNNSGRSHHTGSSKSPSPGEWVWPFGGVA